MWVFLFWEGILYIVDIDYNNDVSQCKVASRGLLNRIFARVKLKQDVFLIFIESQISLHYIIVFFFFTQLRNGVSFLN